MQNRKSTLKMKKTTSAFIDKIYPPKIEYYERYNYVLKKKECDKKILMT